MSVRASLYARLATALHPIMDNLRMSVHFWSAPNRTLWDKWRRFVGERLSPGDSIDFLVPTVTTTADGITNKLSCYLGIRPDVALEVNTLPFRMYNSVYNEHYRSQDLQLPVPQHTGDGPDPITDYPLQRRGKRADYFTTALPAPQKGEPVSIPLGTEAPVLGIGIDTPSANANTNVSVREAGDNDPTYAWTSDNAGGLSSVYLETEPAADGHPRVRVDLTNATSATVIELRNSVAVQQHLEMDARGGTRYPEIIWSQFGTEFQDLRYRPEYLGGGVVNVNISAIANQSGSTGNLGDLAAIGTVAADGIGFSKAFDEHCTVMGIVCVDADLTYQYGLERMWSRRTRFDYFWPSFAFVGDQPIYNKEIYAQGTSADDDVFGYAPRFEEYRTKNNRISGRFHSTDPQSLDSWHLAEREISLPVLGPDWIKSNPPLDRAIAVNTEPHFIFDSLVTLKHARPIPLNGIPGMTRL